MEQKRKGLTERETEILSILWALGEASVEDIRQRLPNSSSASTIRGLITIMEDRKLVTNDGTGYGKRYRPLVSQADVQSSAAQKLIDSLFGGSAEALLLRLMNEEKVDWHRLQALRDRTSTLSGE